MMLNTVLKYYKPGTWDESSYNNERFRLISVQNYTAEYEAVSKYFPYSVRSIRRVQNPYALGAYEIRKAELKHRNIHFNEFTYFINVAEHDVNAALEWNLDNRRAPTLTTPSSNPTAKSGYATIVVNILTHSASNSLMYWSHDRRATYVVSLAS